MIKYCINCGKEIKLKGKYCKECGGDITNVECLTIEEKKKGNRLAIISLCLFFLGTISSVFFTLDEEHFYITNILSLSWLIGLVLIIVAKIKYKNNKLVIIAFWIIMILLLISFISFVNSFINCANTFEC